MKSPFTSTDTSTIFPNPLAIVVTVPLGVILSSFWSPTAATMKSPLVLTVTPKTALKPLAFVDIVPPGVTLSRSCGLNSVTMKSPGSGGHVLEISSISTLVKTMSGSMNPLLKIVLEGNAPGLNSFVASPFIIP